MSWGQDIGVAPAPAPLTLINISDALTAPATLLIYEHAPLHRRATYPPGHACAALAAFDYAPPIADISHLFAVSPETSKGGARASWLAAAAAMSQRTSPVYLVDRAQASPTPRAPQRRSSHGWYQQQARPDRVADVTAA